MDNRIGMAAVLLLALVAWGTVTATELQASSLAGSWRAEGFVIPNHALGVSLITLNGNGSFRAQLGPVGTGTVSGHTASGSWRLQNGVLSFVLMQINNALVSPAVSQPILYTIDLVSASEIQCRNQATGRQVRFVRIGPQ